MSQNPARSRPVPAPPRVSDGIPWWLWLILVVFGLSVVTPLVRKAIPENPQIYIQNGMAAIETGDLAAIERSVQMLKDFPEYAAEQKLLEGLMYLGKSKPLLAIPLFQDASKEPAIRTKALTQLGNAFMRSRQRTESIIAYNSALKEDENTDDARLNLAYVYKDMISWDEALRHLAILVERKFKPGFVQQMMADIYADRGQYAEAAAAYEAAMIADPTNPAHAAKSSRLLACRIETDNLEGIEEFLKDVDAAGVRESARALLLVKKGDVKQALSALDLALKEVPNDATANLTYGKIMAGIGSKEKAIEALTNLQRPFSSQTRSLKLFEVVAELAKIAEKEEIAVTAQQNVDQLKDLELQFSARLAEVASTLEGTQARIELGDLAAAIGHLELARTMYLGAGFMDSTLESAVEAKIEALNLPQPPLVQFEYIGENADTVAPADGAPADGGPADGGPADGGPEATPEPLSEQTPATEKADISKADSPNSDESDVPGKSSEDGTNAPDAETGPAPN